MAAAAPDEAELAAIAARPPPLMDGFSPHTFRWVFRRGAAVVEICRDSSPDADRLIVDGPTGTRVLDFTAHGELVRAHASLEDELLADGWRLVGFASEPATSRVLG
jgi:hypothetical protein